MTTERAEQDTVAYDVRNGIAWVKFNRPEKRNCMSPKLNRQMLRVITDLEFRDDVGVLVLTGEGSAWSAGMDLKEYFRETEAQGLKGVRRSRREAYAWWERLRWYQKVTICRAAAPPRWRQGMKQFLDDKSYKPGLGEYDKAKASL
jgi:trans-feruloyl-CoA hydratase/vanillin synthase